MTTAVIEYPADVAGLYEHLKKRLAHVVPDFELRLKAEVAAEINRIKKEKHAVILGHNYMEPALFHSVPDFTGDSLYLSRVSAKAQAERIVFCGVRFMAETAKILNPTRTVLLPTKKGGCSLAASITAADVHALRALYPGAPVVTYVNCYADVKAASDYCCTSGNAHEVVRHLLKAGHKTILFLPDEYLSGNIAREVGMDIVFPNPYAKNAKAEMGSGTKPLMVGWKGRCEVHERFTVDDILNARKQFPDVLVLSHPECSPEVVKASDYAGSTTQMLKYIDERKSGRLLLLTECSMADNITSQNPDREILRICSIRCPHMGEITLEETLESLKHDREIIEVPEAIRAKARLALDRMIEIG